MLFRLHKLDYELKIFGIGEYVVTKNKGMVANFEFLFLDSPGDTEESH
jgi:hypothetical protein